ncbi:MAG TPA: Xaa-Pro peptidase family protein [Desulfobacteraceae bacterium]|nr:Xaa-Pro peptidase family protein [Desulfobacteraceae bacterium]HPJ67272.1 Xaa-Pro peptidase family protein [Desulfobacteraceae bacterium]
METEMTLSENGLELVPSPEIQSRIEKFQEWMASEELEGAFILQNVDIYYFSGTLQRSILFVPVSGNPLLMVIKSFQRAVNESPFEKVLSISGRDGIFSLLAEFSHVSFRRVGLEMDVLPTAQYLWFRKKLPQTEFIDVSPGIRNLRMIKSLYEAEQIKRATAILGKGYQEIQGLIREGMTELEIDGLLSWISRREGHMGVMRMRGWNQEMTYAHVLSGEGGASISCCETPVSGTGNSPAMPQGAGFRRVCRNEPIYIDYGVAVNGYHSDQTRTFVIGELDKKLARAHDCAREILEKLEAEIMPGFPCDEVFEMAKDIACSRGFEENFMGHGEGKVKFLGHGIGLEIDELPIMAPIFRAPVQEGMVFALEPKFIFPGLGTVGIEDDYLVTSRGLERITFMEQEVICIP